MYYIYTGNKHNQILIFESFLDAYNWCAKATVWTHDEIVKNIKAPRKSYEGCPYSYILDSERFLIN